MRSTSGNSKGKGWEVLNQQYTGNTIQNNIFDVDRSQLTEHEKRLADMLEQQLCQMENVNHQLLERAKHQTSNVQLDYASMQGMQGGQHALARASDKFKRRFQAMEAAVGVDRFADLSLEEMEQQWINVKGLESI